MPNNRASLDFPESPSALTRVSGSCLAGLVLFPCQVILEQSSIGVRCFRVLFFTRTQAQINTSYSLNARQTLRDEITNSMPSVDRFTRSKGGLRRDGSVDPARFVRSLTVPCNARC